MFNSLKRILSIRNIPSLAIRFCSQETPIARKFDTLNQIEYIKSIDDNNALSQDWLAVRKNVITLRGNLNHKNVDAVILKMLVASRNLVAASLFAGYLRTTHEELSLGSINSILSMYTSIGKERELTKEEKTFVLETHRSLYEKYKVLDSHTSEQLLLVLCVLNEWEKGLKLLEDIHISSVPSHLAYSTLIATLFRLNKTKNALKLIEQSVQYKRPLQDIAYEEWLEYILRKYKDKKIIGKYVEEILKHIEMNLAVVTYKTANRFKELYTSLDWSSQFTRIRKSDGQCSRCKESLDCLALSDVEFNDLQQNVKEKLIIGSDILLKTTHDELNRFLHTVHRIAPYDVVLDGLNISYAVGYRPHIDKLRWLEHVVDYFVKQNKRILLLGRQHMLRWNKRMMERIMNKTCNFFTYNLSEDDPYVITAAILSGPHTDIVSKDLLRGHQFNLKDENLKRMFKRWQWQHQWMVFPGKQREPVIQPPLKFTPCAQKKDTTWHIPYACETASQSGLFNDGTPDLNSWLCLRQIL